ncbi:MAG TPA: septal ring lytic transglycosylase RlpA family protein [Gammaproteobacteria bacterium]|nr:septal ring lytic transglycosylase RlpA family protein [Gammaproteobacteria bacterium]
MRNGELHAGYGVVLALLAAMIAGCASTGEQQAEIATDREAVINPQRTRAGNPPVYEVFGERYYVSDSSENYRERGVASWYGKDFHGRSTANGETYNMYALTAAHKTLPIPTWVEVTNLNNGRRVIVKINDRGPFVDDRLIDLSYAAANEIGMVNAGTARVEVRALGVPVGGEAGAAPVLASRGPAEAPSRFDVLPQAMAAEPTSSARPMQQMFAQVGAFSDRGNADRMVDRLKAGGQHNVFVLSENVGRTQLHRVRIGPLAGAAAFDDVQRDLAALGVSESLLVVVN